MRHQGGCHCGAVTFEFTGPAQMSMTECDCSMCNMTGFQHVFIPQADFDITAGEDKITTYTFNSHAAKHMFCSICGVKAFYIPRSHPDCYSVNLRCITPGTLTVSKTITFSGQNWEANIEGLRKDT